MKLNFDGIHQMPRKPTKPDDPEQSKRFIATAEEVGADGDDAALERAFKKIAVSGDQGKTTRHSGRSGKSSRAK